MHRLARLLLKIVEVLCALAFGALFAVFLLQIFFRYVLDNPLPWSEEIAAILYVWIVCVGAATIVSEREHVSFSLIYHAVRPRIRRVLAILGTGFVAVTVLVTLYGNFDYIAFTTRQKTPTLRLPMSVVFSAFGVFCVLIVLNGALRLYRLSRSNWEQEP